jgi:ABC-2 type transport system permease protein
VTTLAAARPYGLLLVAGFRRRSAYLAAAVGGLVANATFGLLKAAILVATVEAAGGDLAGYGTGEMLAFVWIGQGMLGLINVYGRDVLGEKIRSGDVVVDFLRPLHLQLSGLATELGERLFSLLPRGVPTVLVGALTTGFAMPAAVAPYVLGAVSVLLAMVLSYFLVYALNILGLWVVEVRGIQVAYMVVAGFFSGLYVPIWIFPEWLQVAALATPFPSLMMTPIDLLTGRSTGLDALVLLAAQLGWVVGFGLLGAWLTAAGRRHLEVQGG